MTLAVNLANLVDGLGADGTITDAKSISDKPNTSTGYFDLPSGTTGQRPGSPTTGMVRHNSSLGLIETWNGTAWTGLGGSATVSGTAPASPTEGAFWLNSETGDLYTYGPGGWIVVAGFSGSYSDLTGKPTLATVATSGSYTDLINKPSIITPATVSDQANTSTGYFGMPSGTTAERPVSATSGATRVNTTTNYIEMYYGGSWVNVIYIGLVTLNYTGTATVATVGNYNTLTFTGTTGSLTCTSVPSGGVLEIVVIGGGGGGGNCMGGGGGAGGLIYSNAFVPTAGFTYNFSIGTGGAGAPNRNVAGSQGTQTTAFGYTAVGGGGGCSWNAVATSGGSGGGGGTGIGSAPGSGTAGQGFAGGAGAANVSGAGGGGAGGVGSALSSGPGGPGYIVPSTGLVYAGGGGGGWGSGYGASNGGAGGTGGGGSGGQGGVNGTNGTPNTGSGGGGGGYNGSDFNGGQGGSGTVIVRYRFQ